MIELNQGKRGLIDGVLEELQNPIQVKIEDIIYDMNKLKRGLANAIPHSDGNKIHDHVHAFKYKSFEKPKLNRKDIDTALEEIENK